MFRTPRRVVVFLSAENFIPRDFGRLLWPPAPAWLEHQLFTSGFAVELYVQRVLDSTTLLGTLPLPAPYSSDDNSRWSLLIDLDCDLRQQLHSWINPLCPAKFDGVPPVRLCRAQPWISLPDFVPANNVMPLGSNAAQPACVSSLSPRFIGLGIDTYPTLEHRVAELRPWVSSYHLIGQSPKVLAAISHANRLSSSLLDPSGRWRLNVDALPMWTASADRLERTPDALLSQALQSASMPHSEPFCSSDSNYDLLLLALRRQLSLLATSWLSWKTLTTHLERLTPSGLELLRRIEPEVSSPIFNEPTIWDSEERRWKMTISVDRFIVPETSAFVSDALDDSLLLRTVSID